MDEERSWGRVGIGLAAALTLAACGGGGSTASEAGHAATDPGYVAAATLSCDDSLECRDINAPAISGSQQSAFGTLCFGTLAWVRCPTAGKLAGHCYWADGSAGTGITITGSTARRYYVGTSWAPQQAQTDCTGGGGAWIP